jgi:hypothetical protein
MATVFLALAASGCGATVSANNVAPTAPERFASCAEVRAACTGEAETVVRAFAQGIAAHNGARFRFAVRYVTEQGNGINVSRGLSVGGAEVRDGAVEACVCARNANVYPQVSYVLFAPGTTETRADDVSWASFMQLYAIRGDNELALTDERPSRAVIESSLAALVDRTVTVRVTDLDAALEGRALLAGLLSDERVVATDRTRGEISEGATTLRWVMPGRPSASERVVLVLDNNSNHRCDVGDSVTAIPLAADPTTVSARGAQWSSSADAVAAACAQLASSSG